MPWRGTVRLTLPSFPPALNKANQDCFLVCRNFMRDPNRALFSVFDGHGREGDLCAQFARDLVRVCLGVSLFGGEDGAGGLETTRHECAHCDAH